MLGASQAFEINLGDDRFSSLLAGDPRFGIDRTASEFRETDAMRAILAEQRRRRDGDGDGDGVGTVPSHGDDRREQTQSEKKDDVDVLVNKLKMKYKEVTDAQTESKDSMPLKTTGKSGKRKRGLVG